MPVVLLPIHFDRDTAPIQSNREPSVQRSIVLRPFVTNDFMTGEAAIPGQHLPLDVRVPLTTRQSRRAALDIYVFTTSLLFCK